MDAFSTNFGDSKTPGKVDRHMNPARETAKQFILFALGLDLPHPARSFFLRFLISQARTSQRALETVREIYSLAATDEWQPTPIDLSTLVYGPLDYPGLIPQVQEDVYHILNRHPNEKKLHSGWNYVQHFSPMVASKS